MLSKLFPSTASRLHRQPLFRDSYVFLDTLKSCGKVSTLIDDIGPGAHTKPGASPFTDLGGVHYSSRTQLVSGILPSLLG
jgi:hypothetical protein